MTLIRKLLARIGLGPKKSEEQRADSLGEKLHDIHWKTDEDAESERKMAAGAAAKGDDLAGAVYRGRPTNPLSGDD